MPNKFSDAINWLIGDNQSSGKRTITVAKPFCSPARDIITGALTPYGVKIHEIQEEHMKISLLDFARKIKVEARTLENLKYAPAAVLFLPLAVYAHVTVNAKAAGWAEYLLLRTGKLYVPGKYVNQRNQEWAERHGGQMPQAWHEKRPWIERTCGEGRAAMREAEMALKTAQKSPTEKRRR